MTKTILFGVILGVLVLTGLSVNEAYGAVFAKYDGVDGESKDKVDHDKWIDILNVDWGAKRSDSGETRARSAPVVQDMILTMEYDKASPKLLEKLLMGEVIPKLEIEQTANYGGERQTYLKYELKNVMITSYQFSASGNDEAGPPTVVISNNFEEVKVTYTEYGDDGSAKGNVETSYNVKKGKR